MIDLADLPDLDALTDDQVLSLLGRVAADLEASQARVTALFELRLEIYKAARRRQPPITQVRLAESARVSEVAVIQAIRKDAKAQAAAAETASST